MEIEPFWKYTKPFKKIEKGNNRGRLSYGYIPRRKEKGWRFGHPYRKAIRQIRKYGFDFSETWSLWWSIQRWLSDEFGGFFRYCGDSDNWTEYSLTGQNMDYLKKIYNYEKFQTIYKETWQTRYNSFQEHLKDLLDTSDEQTFKKIADFCAPRIRYLAKTTNGYPGTEEFPTYEKWIETLNEMASEFEQGRYSPAFITHFFALWD